MTWAPGVEMMIKDRLCAEGGWIDKPNMTCFNLYRPPTIDRGNASEGRSPGSIMCARSIPTMPSTSSGGWRTGCSVPHEKINHALVLGGEQGIGKDTMLEPVKHAVGPWNFVEVSPPQMLGRFNGFLKSRHPAGQRGPRSRRHRPLAFYDHMKTYTAAPPDVLRVDEKNLREYSSSMSAASSSRRTTRPTASTCRPTIGGTTWLGRPARKETSSELLEAAVGLVRRTAAIGHVAAYLAELDLCAFDPKAPPPKTPAFWDIVDANRAPEEGELEDIFDKLGKQPDSDKIVRPDAFTLSDIVDHADLRVR